MKYLILTLLLLSVSGFARTRSFFKAEESKVIKTIYNGNLKVDERPAAVIEEYKGAKLVVFKTNGFLSAPISVMGIPSMAIHSIADNYSYALFFDSKNLLPPPISNNLSSFISNSEIRSMFFGDLKGGGDKKSIPQNIPKDSKSLIVIFDNEEKSKVSNVIFESCSSRLLEFKSGKNYKSFKFKQKESCPLRYSAPEKSSISYFIINNNLQPTVMGFIFKTRKIILNLRRKLRFENKKKAPNEKAVASLQKKIKKEKRELRLLKQFLERINEQ
ncbi:MAG: hypothetical protein KAG61_06810 [Bacteriovoracaceae bacterium]|nr:hypothetical protein [Bacteriovoracaceae bacterium]